jgi:NitT/TauT family transport system ATP-binding protein
MGELLKIDHVSYTYHNPEGETQALSDVSFHVNEGEFIAIVGPVGCGKSTLLSLLAGLLSPSSGYIAINGMDIKSSGRNIGYILQKDHLPDWQGTQKSVPPGPEIHYKLTNNSYVQINELLNTYGLITFQDSFSPDLPSGVRQRATLIRTLLLEPDILLLDEPFSTLEGQNRLEAAEDIRDVIHREKKTAILITHDIPEAIRMSDRIIILSKSPGTVKKILDIKLFLDSRTPLTAESEPEFMEYLSEIQKELNYLSVQN